MTDFRFSLLLYNRWLNVFGLRTSSWALRNNDQHSNPNSDLFQQRQRWLFVAIIPKSIVQASYRSKRILDLCSRSLDPHLTCLSIIFCVLTSPRLMFSRIHLYLSRRLLCQKLYRRKVIWRIKSSDRRVSCRWEDRWGFTHPLNQLELLASDAANHTEKQLFWTAGYLFVQQTLCVHKWVFVDLVKRQH